MRGECCSLEIYVRDRDGAVAGLHDEVSAMVTMGGGFGRPERDPVLLAFINCHLTSIARWNTLRVLAESPGYAWTVGELARAARTTGDAARLALDEAAEEGLVERRDGADGPTYTLDLADPTYRVLARLLTAADRSEELRQLIVARIRDHGRGAASPVPVSALR